MEIHFKDGGQPQKSPVMRIHRQQEAEQLASIPLGQRIRAERLSRQFTLEDVSRLTGVAVSTLSKIENEQISPTFQIVQKLIQGLEINLPQLFSPVSNKPESNGRRAFTPKGQGIRHYTPTYEHELLLTDISPKKMFPNRSRVRARSFEEFDDWIRHEGEEFLIVLQGRVNFLTEFYAPLPLSEGDCVYYDAQMGHCLISVGDDDAEVLWVTAQ